MKLKFTLKFSDDMICSYLIRNLVSNVDFKIYKSDQNYDYLDQIQQHIFVPQMNTCVQIYDGYLNIVDSEVKLFTIGLDNNVWCFEFDINIKYNSPLLVANNKISKEILLFVEDAINHLSSKWLAKYATDDYIKLEIGDEFSFLKFKGSLSEYGKKSLKLKNTIKKNKIKENPNMLHNPKNNFDISVDEDKMVINKILRRY